MSHGCCALSERPGRPLPSSAPPTGAQTPRRAQVSGRGSWQAWHTQSAEHARARAGLRGLRGGRRPPGDRREALRRQRQPPDPAADTCEHGGRCQPNPLLEPPAAARGRAREGVRCAKFAGLLGGILPQGVLVEGFGGRRHHLQVPKRGTLRFPLRGGWGAAGVGWGDGGPGWERGEAAVALETTGDLKRQPPLLGAVVRLLNPRGVAAPPRAPAPGVRLPQHPGHIEILL